VRRAVGRRRAGSALCALLALGVGVAAPSSDGSSLRRAELLSGLAVAEQSTLPTRLLERAEAGHEVRVEISARRPAAVRSLVARLGGRVEMSYGRLLDVTVPSAALRALQRDASVRFVREPLRPVAEAVRGEGVAATGARTWHRAGARGAGVRVAVVDLGFGGWRESRANGDLPQSTVAVDYCPGSFEGVRASSHGTAVAEIVAEMAPEARLYLICVSNIAGLARAKDYARANRIHVVNHSASWFNAGRGDDSGGLDTPSGIVADARAAGILWVNAAGNRAQQHWSGTFADANANGWHEFVPGDEGNTIVVGGGQATCMALKWDNWPVTAVDYDLYLVRASDGVPVQFSATDQNGALPPTELICHFNASTSAQLFAVAIRLADAAGAPAPRLDLFVYPGPNLEHQVADGSVTEPGSSSRALTVGAVCWQTNGLESFSSRGPTIDGRTKPDLVGPDWVSSFSYGPFGGCGGQSGFAGTSASAPHVAGAAALVKSANPSWGANELQAYLEANALDLGVPGRDSSFGAGRLALGAAPRVALRTCVVPRLRGARLSVAKARIRKAGCSVGRVRQSRSRMTRGRVVLQRPAAGRRVSRGTRVTLTISRGRR
jgi:subtilisin family serine protease